MSRKLKVLFFQSQSYLGADSLLHSLLMRYYDRSRFEVHVACNYGTRREKSNSLATLETIPDLHIRPTNFGPTIHSQSKRSITRNIAAGLPAFGSLVGL